MPAYDLDTDARQIAVRLATSDVLLIACVCAAWCDTCSAYRATFDALADRHPDICWVWIDVETHEEMLEGLEIENFPTILIEDAHCMRFCGSISSKRPILERLVNHFRVTQRKEKSVKPKLWSMLKGYKDGFGSHG